MNEITILTFYELYLQILIESSQTLYELNSQKLIESG
jgi:hypothetical protein